MSCTWPGPWPCVRRSTVGGALALQVGSRWSVDTLHALSTVTDTVMVARACFA
ncbi:hypothetical protein [Burkholderia gladioli]|uniref:hypothetical protein n=1 Tax=Burkholderia gladioli TaxID=28095 RepID=UPI0015E3B3FB|nr:hypothetical protein [Burkholderia gladioli]